MRRRRGMGRAAGRGAAAALVWLALVLGGCGSSADDDGGGGGPDATTSDAATTDAAGTPDTASGTPGDAAAPGADVGTPGVDVAAPDPYASERHRLREIHLGERSFDEYGYTEAISFTVPEGTASVFLLVDGEDGVHYVLSMLKAPDETFLVPNSWDLYGDPTLCLVCENRISAGEGTGTFMLPAAPQVAVTPGRYVFKVRAYQLKFTGTFPNIRPSITPSLTKANVRVLLREELPVGAMAFLDLNLHFTGAGGVTAADAPGDPIIEEMVTTIDRIYLAVGIRVGDVRYYDAPEELDTIETVMGEDADLARLFRHSEGTPPAVNLFFVDTIVDRNNPMTMLGIILGIAGGIPGPPIDPGSPRYGVAVLIDPPDVGDSVTVGTIAAHEMGHYLGLYHTSEQPMAGNIHDQIEDTPMNSGTNLMYYTSDGSDPTLTEGQGYVMRRHPLVYNLGWAEEGSQ